MDQIPDEQDSPAKVHGRTRRAVLAVKHDAIENGFCHANHIFSLNPHSIFLILNRFKKGFI